MSGWSKHTNFEDTTRVPFILRVPGVTDKGMRTKAFVEHLWTYSPLLLSWLALMFHQYAQRVTVNLLCALKEQVLLLFSQIQIKSGKKCCLFSVPTSSWRNDPDAKWTTPWYNQAFWAILGYSIRVDQYRFTEWYWFNHPTATANTSSCVHPVATHGHPTG